MATFTITTTTNMTALTGKGGNDTYNINGGNLTIDSDTRYGPNTSLSTGPFGNIGLSATLGGTLTISGQNVRLIPITSTSGNVPASGTTISCGGVTAELLCVMTLRTGGTVVAAGNGMPPAGWLKVRNVSAPGSFPIGVLTGIGCRSTATDTVGWIEVVGVETLTLTVNRLNTLTVNGAWFSVGSTTGVRGQTVQLPYFSYFGSGVGAYPGVEIETSPGSGVYKFWANAGNLFVGSGLGTDSRARLVGIDDAGLMTIGTGRDSASAGDLPVSGCDIRIPNIITSNTNATVGFGVNATPNGTMGSRYELATSASGVVNISKVTGAWYWNIQQPYSVVINDLHTCEQFVLAETSTAAIIDGLHVGSSNQSTPYASNSIVFQQCLNGGTANNVTGLRPQSISTSGYSIYCVNIYGGWTFTNIRGHFASDPTALCGPIFFNTCDSVNVTNIEVIGKRLILSACSNFTLNNLYYADNIKATTTTAVSSNALEVMGNSKNITFTNMYNWPGVANVHPYGGAVFANTTFDSIFSGIGTSTVPFECGSVAANRAGYMFNDGGLNKNVKFQRNWLNNLRLGLASSTNTSQIVRMQNCYNTDASLSQGPNWYNSTVRGNRQNGGAIQITFTHVDGMHFYDAYTGDTTAKAFLVFTEKSTTTASAYVINSGTPKFTSTGSLVMQTTGDQITWTWNYFILGWNSLSNYSITGTNQSTNHTQEYDIDKGNGFSGTFKTVSATNLAAETGISPTTGFRLKIRITCTAGATTNVLTSLVFLGNTTLALQNAALYPLDTIGLTISGIQPGSDVVIYQAGTTTVLDTGDNVGATSYTYGYMTPQLVDIGVLCAGYVPYFIRNYQLTTTPTSLPVAQVFDRSYQ
jgi:hypothetical protein